MGESLDDCYIHDTMVTLIFLTARTNIAPVRATRGVVSVKFWNFSVALAKVGGY